MEEQRAAQYHAAGVGPGVSSYELGTDIPQVVANLDNIESAQAESLPDNSNFIMAEEWIGSLVGLGENATAKELEIAEYLAAQKDYADRMVESEELTLSEADDYMGLALKEAERDGQGEKSDNDQLVEQKVGEKVLSSVA